MNAGELTAAADVFGLLDELLAGIKIAYYDDVQWQGSVERAAEAKCALVTLRAELLIDAQYPSLAEAPLRHLRKRADRLRTRLADIRAAEARASKGSEPTATRHSRPAGAAAAWPGSARAMTVDDSEKGE
jgi:hypothetical protein